MDAQDRIRMIHRAGAEIVEAARGLSGYTFSDTRGGLWGALVASYALRLADLADEAITAAGADLRWSCQLLLRSMADTWLHGRYLIAGGNNALDRLVHGWGRHIDGIIAANRPDEPRPAREGTGPPHADHIATLLDKDEPPASGHLSARHVYATIWKPHSDWAAHGGLSAVHSYPQVRGGRIALEPTVPSEFRTSTTSTLAIQLLADFTRRAFDALEVSDVPDGVYALLDTVRSAGSSVSDTQ